MGMIQIIGFVLIGLGIGNRFIFGPYTMNVEMHQLVDLMCIVVGIILLLTGFLLSRRK